MDLQGAEAGAERRAARRAGLAQRREAHARARAAASGSPLRRRRGAELEDALLEAVWDELASSGYAELTYERVAYRAATSRSVVYRRWPTKAEMVLAAIAHRGARSALHVPDTGSLRGDLLATLRSFNELRPDAMVVFGLQVGTFALDSGLSLATVRQSWMGDRETGLVHIVERAIARGEVEEARATPRAVQVALDLLRHDVLMRMDSVSDVEIVEIVDQVAVPLLTGRPPEKLPAA